MAERLQPADPYAGFLQRLAAGDGLDRLAFVDDAGHGLDQPRFRIAGGVGAGPELLDQHHLIARRIVGQDADGMAALEDLARDLGAHAAGMALVPQPVAVDREISLEDTARLHDLDAAGRVGWLCHRR